MRKNFKFLSKRRQETQKKRILRQETKKPTRYGVKHVGQIGSNSIKSQPKAKRAQNRRA